MPSGDTLCDIRDRVLTSVTEKEEQHSRDYSERRASEPQAAETSEPPAAEGITSDLGPLVDIGLLFEGRSKGQANTQAHAEDLQGVGSVANREESEDRSKGKKGGDRDNPGVQKINVNSSLLDP